MEPESEVGVSLEILSEKATAPLTAFSNFIAAQTSSGKEQSVAQIHEHLGSSKKGMVEEVSRSFKFPSLFLEIPTSRILYIFISFYV